MWLVVDKIVVVAVIVVIYGVSCGSLNACRLCFCVECKTNAAVITLRNSEQHGGAFIVPEFQAMTKKMSKNASGTRKCITCSGIEGIPSSKVGCG